MRKFDVSLDGPVEVSCVLVVWSFLTYLRATPSGVVLSLDNDLLNPQAPIAGRQRKTSFPHLISLHAHAKLWPNRGRCPLCRRIVRISPTSHDQKSREIGVDLRTGDLQMNGENSELSFFYIYCCMFIKLSSLCITALQLLTLYPFTI